MNDIPLIVHVVYRFQIGGLEMLLAETINRIPCDKYRHAVVCLTDHTDFVGKVERSDVEFICLHKSPGWSLKTHIALWKVLRRLKPTILHTYNLAAAEYAFTAALAGVPIRIHAEHGRDTSDPQGTNRRHNLLRRLLIPFIDCFIPVSAELQTWLRKIIRVPDGKNLLINNGVDTDVFSPLPLSQAEPAGTAARPVVIGAVGRIVDVKNHAGLIDAFVELRRRFSGEKYDLRLVIIGSGPLMGELQAKVQAAGLGDAVWLPGARNDIAELMRGFSIFALPSIAEGTPVTVLEAMSHALPVVATNVGGLPEAVAEKCTGLLVPPKNTEALANALAYYVEHPETAAAHGRAGRERVLEKYSMAAMIASYIKLYDALCTRKTRTRKPLEPCAE